MYVVVVAAVGPEIIETVMVVGVADADDVTDVVAFMPWGLFRRGICEVFLQRLSIRFNARVLT